MHYHLCAGIDHALRMIDRHSGSEVAYCTKRKLQALHPAGDFTIIGEIGNFARRYAKQDVIETTTGRIIPVFPLGTCRRPLEWIVGYAPLGDRLYVAVVKGIIPRVLPQRSHDSANDGEGRDGCETDEDASAPAGSQPAAHSAELPLPECAGSKRRHLARLQDCDRGRPREQKRR